MLKNDFPYNACYDTICPHCQADLTEHGLRVWILEWVGYVVTLDQKGHLVDWESDDTCDVNDNDVTVDPVEIYCGYCNEKLIAQKDTKQTEAIIKRKWVIPESHKEQSAFLVTESQNVDEAEE